jgi:hypothetical protein
MFFKFSSEDTRCCGTKTTCQTLPDDATRVNVRSVAHAVFSIRLQNMPSHISVICLHSLFFMFRIADFLNLEIEA